MAGGAKINFLFLPLLLLILACASHPTFQPEVEDGGIVSHGGIVYSIPRKNPQIKMKLVSMAIPKKTGVHVRMFFKRIGPPEGEYLDPKEQSIVLPDSTTEIYPERIHASVVGKPMIRLAEVEKQSIEFVFRVPDTASHEYPYIKLNWKIHYLKNGKDHFVSGTDRFDLVEKVSSQMDPRQYDGETDFPYWGFYSGPFPDEWATPGWQWW